MEAAEAILTGAVLWLKLGAEAVSAVLVGVGMVATVYEAVRLREARTRLKYLRVRLTMARFLVLALEFQLARRYPGHVRGPDLAAARSTRLYRGDSNLPGLFPRTRDERL